MAIKVIEYVSNYVIDKYYINNEIKNAKQRLKNVEKVLGNLVKALAKTGNDEAIDSVVERIKSSEEEKADILKEKSKLEKQEDKSPRRITQKEIRNSLGNMFVDVVGQKERRKVAKIIDNSVESIIVYKEKVQINYDLGFVFPDLNHFIRMSVTLLKSEMEKNIQVLWYEISDIANDEIKIDYKIKRNKEKRQLIFQNGVHKKVVPL